MSIPPRALVVSAHPDDIEFACAGTAAVWSDAGCEVTYVIVTDGSTGTQDQGLIGSKLADIRREESIAAAKICGVENVVFLGYRDGYVEPTLDLRRDIAREFRKARPHALFAMDPVPIPGGWFVNHPDHRAVGQCTLDITITAGTTPGHFPELLDEGFKPWRGLRDIYVMGPGGGETPTDITTAIDRKIEALKAHTSQVPVEMAENIRVWNGNNGKEHGLEYAELFHLIHPLGAPEED